MQTVPVGIIGASGYSGLELSRILALHHPHVEIKLLGSDKWAGESAARRAGLPGAAGKLKYAPQDRSAELARECAVVFLATPAEASLQLAPALLDAAVRVIDLSGAFRLRDAAFYPKFYGFAHPRPDLLAKAFYGLPELHRTPKGAALVHAGRGAQLNHPALLAALDDGQLAGAVIDVTEPTPLPASPARAAGRRRTIPSPRSTATSGRTRCCAISTSRRLPRCSAGP